VGDEIKHDQQQGQVGSRTAVRRVLRAFVLFIIVFVMVLVATIGVIWENTADLGAALATFTGEQGLGHLMTVVLIAIGIVIVIGLGLSRPLSPRRERE